MRVQDDYVAERRSSKTVVLTTAELSHNRHRPDRIEVRFADATGGRPIAVTVHVPDGVRASDMRRFRWTEWFAWADLLVREFADDRDPIQVDDASLIAGVLEARGESARRPGRRGHTDGHYERVADAYRQLVAQGARNPTAQLAEREHISRSTAAGWVRGARARGHLPPARHGRAG